MGNRPQDNMIRTAARSLVRTAFCRTAAVAPLKRMPVARMLAIKADSSSHSDFGAVSHQDVPESITERIEQDLSADDVVLYMKGIPSAPQCGFSNAVVRVLEAEGVADYAAYNALEDGDLREGIKKFSDWPTVPQVYVKGEFVGGCDIMIQMHKDGDLAELLQENGVKCD